MLKIQDVTFKNIFCFGNRPQTVEFLPGLNLVTGYNPLTKRSNGSGKSSFMSLISYALFGKTDKDLSKDRLLNSKNKKNLEVVLNFTYKDTPYSILRAIKPDKLEFYKNGSLLSNIPSSVRDLQSYIEEEILNIDYKTFSNVVYTNPNSLIPILKAKKQQKRDILERIFNLQYFTNLNENCNFKITSTKEKIKEDTYSISSFNENINLHNSEIEKLNIKISEIENSSNKFLIIQKDYNEKLNNLNIQSLLLSTNTNNQTNLKEILSTMKEVLLKTKSSQDKLNIKIKNVNDNITKSENTRKALETLKKSIEETDISSLTQSLTNTKEEIESLEFIVKQLHIDRELAENQLSEELGILRQIKETSKAFYDEKTKSYHSSCPTCGQDIDKEKLDSLLKNQQEKVENTRNLLKIEDIKASIVTRKKELEEVKAKQNTIEQEITKYDKNKNMLETLNSTTFNTKNPIFYVKALEKLDIFLNKLKEEIKPILNKINSLSQEESEIKRNIEDLEKWISSYRILESKNQTDEELNKEYKKSIEEHKQQIDFLKNSISAKESNTRKSNKIIDYLEYIKTLCKDDNARQYVISSKLPYINERVNHYLSEVGTGFYVELDKWLDVEIKGPGIHNFVYNNLSGGESKALDVALQIALSDLVSLQTVSFPDILVFDELLDSSVDQEGVMAIMNIVSVKQKEEKNKTFVISHRKEMKDFEFDHVYYVERGKNGYSTVSVM